MKCTGKEWDHCRVEKMGCIGCYYDEITEDEYVRTDNGYIFTVDKERKVLQALRFLDMQYGNIVKHSKNAIELIVEKDVVRYKVNKLGSSKIAEVKKYRSARSGEEYLGVEGFGLEQIEILELMTKEKFKQESFEIKYREDIENE